MLLGRECRLWVETAETSDEIATARDDERENCGDDGTALDSALVGDRVELTYHLWQSPCAERCEHNYAKEAQWIRTEP